MKINAAFAMVLLLVTPVAMVVPTQAKPQGKTAPHASKTEAAGEEEKKDEPTVPGNVVERKDGKGFLSLVIADGGFKLSFYDKDKKPTQCDVSKATARWRPNYKIGEERRVLNPAGDGMSLVSADVKPPYHFRLYLNLLSDKDEAVESYSFDFRQ